jgi:Fe-S-cluster containining protein
MGVCVVEDFYNTFKNVLERVNNNHPEGYNETEIFDAVDTAVNTIHNEEVQAILIKSQNGESGYCSQCGRCCRDYGIILHVEDVVRLNEAVDITGNITSIGGLKYKFIDKPCRYLQKDGRCGCYDNRPMTCQNHPLTNPEHPRVLRDPNCDYILNFFYDKSISLLTGQPFGGK